jgi:hypothetical protein
MILEAELPDRVAVDSSVIVPAFTPTHEIHHICNELITFLVRSRTLVVPAVALGERLISGDDRLIGLRGVEIIDFNMRSAWMMAKAIGGRAGLKQAGYPKQVVKFDAMIVGTCIAAGITLLISHDIGQRKTAERGKLKAMDPIEFYVETLPAPQTSLFAND